jgi:hypothetical protein
MKTEIGYLKEFREDLMEAAWRQSVGDPKSGRSRRPRRWRGWSRPRIVALAAAASLVVAGVTGFVALRLTRETYHPLSTMIALTHVHNALATNGNQAGFFSPVYTRGLRGPSTGSNGGGGGKSSGSQRLVNTPGEQTKIVKLGFLSVKVQRGAFDESVQRAIGIAHRYGGFVQRTTTTGVQTGEIDLRVPASKFELAMRSLASLGHVSARTVEGTDVTARFVDFQTRLRIARDRRAVLLRLQAKASSVADVLQVTGALSDTQLTIEQLQGQLRLLRSQTDQSTIRLELSVQGSFVRQSSAIHNPSFGRGFHHAVAGFLGVLVAIVVGLGYLIPIAVFGLMVWVVVGRIRKRRLA